MPGCATCEKEDALLFTCGHCDDQFCAAHQFPHHACTRFTEAGRTENAVVGFEFGDGTVVTSPEPTTKSSSDTITAAQPSPETATEPSSTTTTDTHSSAEPIHVPGPRVDVARDAARETRPDRDKPTPLPPNRGMPWERDSGSIADWMAEQSYPAYVGKIGALSLLFTTAYYAGLAVTLYGYV